MYSARMVEVTQANPFRINERHPPLTWVDLRSDTANIDHYLNRTYIDLLRYFKHVFLGPPESIVSLGINRPKGHPGDIHWLPLSQTGVKGLNALTGFYKIFINYEQ